MGEEEQEEGSVRVGHEGEEEGNRGLAFAVRWKRRGRDRGYRRSFEEYEEQEEGVVEQYAGIAWGSYMGEEEGGTFEEARVGHREETEAVEDGEATVGRGKGELG